MSDEDMNYEYKSSTTEEMDESSEEYESSEEEKHPWLIDVRGKKETRKEIRKANKIRQKDLDEFDKTSLQLTEEEMDIILKEWHANNNDWILSGKRNLEYKPTILSIDEIYQIWYHHMKGISRDSDMIEEEVRENLVKNIIPPLLYSIPSYGRGLIKMFCKTRGEKKCAERLPKDPSTFSSFMMLLNPILNKRTRVEYYFHREKGVSKRVNPLHEPRSRDSQDEVELGQDVHMLELPEERRRYEKSDWVDPRERVPEPLQIHSQVNMTINDILDREFVSEYTRSFVRDKLTELFASLFGVTSSKGQSPIRGTVESWDSFYGRHLREFIYNNFLEKTIQEIKNDSEKMDEFRNASPADIVKVYIKKLKKDEPLFFKLTNVDMLSYLSNKKPITRLEVDIRDELKDERGFISRRELMHKLVDAFNQTIKDTRGPVDVDVLVKREALVKLEKLKRKIMSDKTLIETFNKERGDEIKELYQKIKGFKNIQDVVNDNNAPEINSGVVRLEDNIYERFGGSTDKYLEKVATIMTFLKEADGDFYDNAQLLKAKILSRDFDFSKLDKANLAHFFPEFVMGNAREFEEEDLGIVEITESEPIDDITSATLPEAILEDEAIDTSGESVDEMVESIPKPPSARKSFIKSATPKVESPIEKEDSGSTTIEMVIEDGPVEDRPSEGEVEFRSSSEESSRSKSSLPSFPSAETYESQSMDSQDSMKLDGSLIDKDDDIGGMATNISNSCYADSVFMIMTRSKSDIYPETVRDSDSSHSNDKCDSTAMKREFMKLYETRDDFELTELRKIMDTCYGDMREPSGAWKKMSSSEFYDRFVDFFPDFKLIIPKLFKNSEKNTEESREEEASSISADDFIADFRIEDHIHQPIEWDKFDQPLLVFSTTSTSGTNAYDQGENPMREVLRLGGKTYALFGVVINEGDHSSHAYDKVVGDHYYSYIKRDKGWYKYDGLAGIKRIKELPEKVWKRTSSSLPELFFYEEV